MIPETVESTAEQLDKQSLAMVRELNALTAAPAPKPVEIDSRKVNDFLRQELGTMAKRKAVERAATVLGVPAAYVELQVGDRIAVEIAPDGHYIIDAEHDPETLMVQAAEQRTSVRCALEIGARGLSDQKAIADPFTDPVATIEALDRNPTEKAKFIITRGGKEYFKLANMAMQARPKGK